MLNEVRLIGNLGKDPEIRRTQSGAMVANLRVATSKKWKDKATGEMRERTEWHSVTCWGDGLCRFIDQYMKKGMQVLVAGSLQTRKWQDQSGQDRFTTEIIVSGFGETVRMLGRKPSDRDAPPHTDDDAPPQHQGYGEKRTFGDDEIPF